MGTSAALVGFQPPSEIGRKGNNDGPPANSRPDRRVERARWLIRRRPASRIFELTTTGEILYLSPSVEAVLGHRPEDLMGREGFAFVHTDEAPSARVGLAAGGRYVLLSVEDTGQGMDEATSAQAFEPFFTTKEVGQGTGLGLSVVYSVVRQAGGAVCVRTRRSNGTCFEIYLPATKQGAVLVDHVAPGAATAAGGETVLVVEDEPSVRNFVRRILEKAGYRFLEAGDGRQALELAQRCEAPTQLLISDVVMPGSNGLELARQLQGRWPGLCVLFISGYPHDHVGVRETPLPAELLPPKPFTHRELLSRVRSLLGTLPPAAQGH